MKGVKNMLNQATIPFMEPAESKEKNPDLKPSSSPAVAKSIVQLFEQLESQLIRFAYGIVHRREVAEEIVQEGFLKLHKHWEEVENHQAWIYRTVRNLAFNHLRKFKKEEVQDKVVDISAGAPENSVERMETIGNVRLLMTELPEKERELVRLKYDEGCSYSEIAERTGMGEGNVGYKLHHILKGLASNLKKLGIESPRG